MFLVGQTSSNSNSSKYPLCGRLAQDWTRKEYSLCSERIDLLCWGKAVHRSPLQPSSGSLRILHGGNTGPRALARNSQGRHSLAPIKGSHPTCCAPPSLTFPSAPPGQGMCAGRAASHPSVLSQIWSGEPILLG